MGDPGSKRSPLRLSLLEGEVGPERTAAVKGAPLGAAERTLDGEDRSENIERERGKGDLA